VANVGDTITAIPSMHKIRKKYPDAKLTLLTSPGKAGAIGAKKILQYTNWIDDITEYFSSDIDSIKKIRKFVSKQRTSQFECFIQLPAENTSFKIMLRNLFFAKAIGAKYATGFYVSTLNLFAQTQNKYMHFPTDCERLLKGLPWESDGKIEFPIDYTKDDEIIVGKTLEKHGVSETERILAISFYGKGKAKHWKIESFHKIAKLWVQNGGKVIVLGGKQQFADGNGIISDLPEGTGINFCGEFSLLQSILLLRKVKLLLTVDTGTAHMASVTKTPCIELFSSFYLRDKWVAYGDNIHVIRNELKCSPCMSKICKYGYPAKCMEAISVQYVWNKIKMIIGAEDE